MQTLVLQIAALSLAVVGIALCAYWLAAARPLVAPVLGSRGERRQRALARGGVFSAIEPLMCLAGAWCAQLPIARLRAATDRRLAEAGHYLGLCADEFFGLCLLSAVAFAGVGGGLGVYFDMPALGVLVGAAIGPILLVWQLAGERDRRFLEISRSLPSEIDLLSMCMGAGMDFAGALRLIVEQAGKHGDVLREEFARILQELDVGHTRATALRGFGERVPTEAVREFVGAVVQAEEKGTPLAEALRIQAGMLRMRRSVNAEEAASRAGVLMMVPLLMQLGSILIILLGAMMIKTYDSGMFG